jgi:Uma2 family endonuclease
MAQAVHHRFSFEEYLRLEEDSATKHEFVGGHVFAMAGGTPEHAAITANVARLLGNALEREPCRVWWTIAPLSNGRPRAEPCKRTRLSATK